MNKTLLIIHIFLFSNFIFAQEELPVDGVGGAGVPFLLISPNARASAMGEAGVGLADDASAIFWNPAGLGFQTGEGGSMTHSPWLPQFGFSDLFYDYLNYKYNLEDVGTLGASVTFLNLGEFIRTGEDSPEEIGRWKAYEGAFTIGGGFKVTENFSLGLNLRYIRSALAPFGTAEEQGSGTANAISFDVGTMFKENVEDIGTISTGLSLSNVGPKIAYIDEAQADPLPTTLRFGFGYEFKADEYNSLTYTVDFSRLLTRRNYIEYDDKLTTNDEGDTIPNPDYGRYTDGDEVLPSQDVERAIFSSWSDGSKLRRITTGMGLEYWYGAPKLLALRLGWFYEDPKYGNRNILTFGAGLRYDEFGFDFSYINKLTEEFSPLDGTLRFTVMMELGNVSSQIFDEEELDEEPSTDF